MNTQIKAFDAQAWTGPHISEYRPIDKETADTIIEMVSDGYSLTAACKRLGISYRTTVYRWMREHVEFAEMYKYAITCAGMAHGDNVAHLAAEAMADLRAPDGSLNTDAAAIILKASPWLAERLAPAIYNPKQVGVAQGPSVPKIEFSQADQDLC
jgi:hypothetical protein